MVTEQPIDRAMDAIIVEDPLADSPTVATVGPAVLSAQKKPGMLRSVVDNRWMVLGMLFGVTGALGLPALWASRAFSTVGKIFWSIVVTLYTILILWLFWLVMVWCYTRVAESLS